MCDPSLVSILIYLDFSRGFLEYRAAVRQIDYSDLRVIGKDGSTTVSIDMNSSWDTAWSISYVSVISCSNFNVLRTLQLFRRIPHLLGLGTDSEGWSLREIGASYRHRAGVTQYLVCILFTFFGETVVITLLSESFVRCNWKLQCPPRNLPQRRQSNYLEMEIYR